MYTLLDNTLMLGSIALLIVGIVMNFVWMIVVGPVLFFVHPVITEVLFNTAALLFFSKDSYKSELDRRRFSMKNKNGIVYHPRYNITAFGLEKLHPFDAVGDVLRK